MSLMESREHDEWIRYKCRIRGTKRVRLELEARSLCLLAAVAALEYLADFSTERRRRGILSQPRREGCVTAYFRPLFNSRIRICFFSH